jgi:uncharacterized protein (TIGR03086 family)
MSTEALEKAYASTRSVLANVSQEQLDDPTPCASWSVRDLLNHIVGGPFFQASMIDPDGYADSDSSPDYASGDFVSDFDAGAKLALAGFGTEGAMERIVKAPFGEVPGSIFVWVVSVDTFAHGWDLARATGQSTDLDPALAEQLLEVSRLALNDDLRGDDRHKPFGPEVQVPDDLSAADKLAGFLGRQP